MHGIYRNYPTFASPWLSGGYHPRSVGQSVSAYAATLLLTLLPKDMRGAGLPLSDGVAELMVSAGLRHSFEETQPDGTKPPGSSAWSGGLVDFFWHLRAGSGPGLRCVGSWLVYDDASDHLPLVADYVYDAG